MRSNRASEFEPELKRLGSGYINRKNREQPRQLVAVTPAATSSLKNSSVALTIGLIELTAAARSMSEFSFQVFEAFTGATLIYIIINIVVVSGMRWLERRVAVPGFISMGQPAAAH